VDLVGVSYVRTEEDIASVRRVLKSLGRPTPLVAKIETKLALENLVAILARSDAVMIARGDLSLEIPFERVPIEQKRIVQAAIRAGRPAITATQMLQSMVSAPRPTRAEITDVANAVLDGTDAVMLSDETAIGVDPVRACRAMSRIIDATEDAYPTRAETPIEGVRGATRAGGVLAGRGEHGARDPRARS
jgi:pyruvate kinase